MLLLAVALLKLFVIVFLEYVIKKLEELKWYKWDLQKIMENKKELGEVVGFDVIDFK